jgi:hypothetical protein
MQLAALLKELITLLLKIVEIEGEDYIRNELLHVSERLMHNRSLCFQFFPLDLQ